MNHSFLSSGELKAATQLVMGHPGQPRTKVVSEGKLHSVMSETLSETHISERRSWSLRLKTFCGVLLEFVMYARKNACYSNILDHGLHVQYNVIVHQWPGSWKNSSGTPTGTHVHNC